jgi:hypothetical protein
LDIFEKQKFCQETLIQTEPANPNWRNPFNHQTDKENKEEKYKDIMNRSDKQTS